MGQLIQIENDLDSTDGTASKSSANVTEEGPFYLVSSISGDGRTLYIDESGGRALSSAENRQAVVVSAITLDPRGVSAEVAASFNGSTITVTDGSVLSDVFNVGMKILVSGNTDHENTTDNLYTVQSVGSDTIVFAETINAANETGLTLTIDQFVEIVALQVQLREDVDIQGVGSTGLLEHFRRRSDLRWG